jgi:hypothetical protein
MVFFLLLSNDASVISDRLKRFNDIYTLLFVVITSLLTFNIALFDTGDFAFTILFILGSLSAWTVGHLIGANAQLRYVQVQLKAHFLTLCFACCKRRYSKVCSRHSRPNGDMVRTLHSSLCSLRFRFVCLFA